MRGRRIYNTLKGSAGKAKRYIRKGLDKIPSEYKKEAIRRGGKFIRSKVIPEVDKRVRDYGSKHKNKEVGSGINRIMDVATPYAHKKVKHHVKEYRDM